MDAVGPPPAAPRRSRIAWGLPDVAIAWGAGVLLSIFSAAFAPGAHAPRRDMVPELIAALVLQSIGIIGALYLISRQKGQDSMEADFGLTRPDRTLGWDGVVIWLVAGIGVSLLATAILAPITSVADLHGKASQGVSKTVESARGIGVVLLALSVAIVAPVTEELLFRGALLRGLLRRTTAPWAVFGSALIFAAAHVVGDPGAGYVFPGLLLLGLVSGYQAVRTGNLARSMMLHIGFNVISTIFLLR